MSVQPLPERRDLLRQLGVAADLARKLPYAANANGEPEDEWPLAEPVPHAVIRACEDLIDAIYGVDKSIADTKHAYRKRVLEWLLAEASQ